MNKTDKIKKKLQIVMYVLIILSILRSFIARASAEEFPSSSDVSLYPVGGIPDYVKDYIVDYFSSAGSSYIDTLETAFDNSSSFLFCEYSNGTFCLTLVRNYGTGVFCYNCGNFGGNSKFISDGIYNFTNNYDTLTYISRISSTRSYGFISYLTSYNSGDIMYYNFFHNTSGFDYDIAYCRGRYGNGYPSGTNYYASGSFKYQDFGSTGNGTVITYGDIWLLSNTNSTFWPEHPAVLKSNYFNTVPEPVDSRFHARTFINSYNQNMLEIKWDSNVYPNTGSFTYLKSVLQLDLMVNGNSVDVSFDSDIYPDLFVSPNSSYIPYMYLNSVDGVVPLQSGDNAYLTKIKLTQYAFPSSASSSSATAYSSSTICNLSLTDSVQLPIWSDPTISQQGSHIIDIATGNVYDNVSFSPPDGYSQQHISDLESVPWADVKVISQVAVSGNTQNVLDDLYENIAFVLMSDWKHFIDSTLTDFNDVAAYIQSENQYTDTYDIIVFLWNENGSELCWVTYTHRYYIRLMYKQFGNFQTIMEGSAAYIADIYDYLFSRLEPLNDNLILYFDSALSNNQTMISYVQSINGFCNSIDNTLFSGFNSVIGSGGRSLTDIYNRLGDISVGGGNSGFILNDFMTAFENKMSYLFVPTYDGLDDNFDTAIDDLGILALPFSFSYELISACKVPYSYTLDITFPSMSIPWHEEMDGGSVDSNLVLWEDYDLSFNPASVIPSDWLEFFQYLNALLVLVSVTLLTYRHIFRHSEGQGGNTL